MKKLGIVLIVLLMLILVIGVISCDIGRDSNTNSRYSDSDGDDLPDELEKTVGTNPNQVDTDGMDIWMQMIQILSNRVVYRENRNQIPGFEIALAIA